MIIRDYPRLEFQIGHSKFSLPNGFPHMQFKVFCKTNKIKIFSEKYIQSWTFAYIRLLNKPYENEVALTGQNPPLKCCQLLELLTQLKKRD